MKRLTGQTARSAQQERKDARRIGPLPGAVILDCVGGGGAPWAVMPWPGDDVTSLALATVGTIRELQAAGRDVRLVDDGRVPRRVIDRISRVMGIGVLKQSRLR